MKIIDKRKGEKIQTKRNKGVAQAIVKVSALNDFVVRFSQVLSD